MEPGMLPERWFTMGSRDGDEGNSGQFDVTFVQLSHTSFQLRFL